VSLRTAGSRVHFPAKGLHRASYRRLLRAHGRIVGQLERLPSRRTWPVVRKRLQTEFQNRLKRVRRRLGLRVPHPPARRWYRTSESGRVRRVFLEDPAAMDRARPRAPVSARRGVTANAAIAIASSCASSRTFAFEGTTRLPWHRSALVHRIIGGISVEEVSSGGRRPDSGAHRRAAGT